MIKDDMAIHAGIPEKAVKAALQQMRSQEALSEVTWDVARSRPGRPIKVYFEANGSAELQLAKRALEQALQANGFELYP
ncbi:hypothetical protein F8S09_15995 [Deinococcus sp. SDU3-2]|uniref:Uncharacterized protein n=1 Tax=Deinococcus terrestris TaxID=2651870 RepID=A0A7X1TT92_9DEIO|nr:hypothetical protein [Deinococcus terrestris]MPY68157.1 hypothetical protein [Deinococcus terrestris]